MAYANILDTGVNMKGFYGKELVRYGPTIDDEKPHCNLCGKIIKGKKWITSSSYTGLDWNPTDPPIWKRWWMCQDCYDKCYDQNPSTDVKKWRREHGLEE